MTINLTTALTTSGSPLPLPVNLGGTGSSTSTGTGTTVLASGPTIASATLSGSTAIATADINGGTIDGTVIGGASAAAITGTTGAFTTLSASGAVTGATTAKFGTGSWAGGAVHAYADATKASSVICDTSDATPPTLYFRNDPVGGAVINTGNGNPLLLKTAGNTRASVSSTGLDVTGALSASGIVTMSNGYLDNTRTQNDTSSLAHALLYRGNKSGTYAGIYTTGNGANGITSLNLHYNGTDIAKVSSTGLYVTGTISASGNITVSTTARNALLTDNDLTFDLNARNNFFCTTSTTANLTFDNIASAAGQSGWIKFVISGTPLIGAATNTKISAANLTRLNSAGTYVASYFCDGTDVYVSVGTFV